MTVSALLPRSPSLPRDGSDGQAQPRHGEEEPPGSVSKQSQALVRSSVFCSLVAHKKLSCGGEVPLVQGRWGTGGQAPIARRRGLGDSVWEGGLVWP